MTAYLLDTNHASPLVTLTHPLRARVLQAVQHGDTFALTSINLAEVLYGISVLPRAVQNKAEWDRLRPALRVYAARERDAVEAVGLQVSLRRRGWQLSTVDAFVAAIALRYDHTLLTTDGDFDAVPELKHTNWLGS